MAEENLATYGKINEDNRRTRFSGPSCANTLIEPLRDLGLVDLAVRSGLGTLLRKYLQNCQVGCWLPGATFCKVAYIKHACVTSARQAAALLPLRKSPE
jgi:hypothetical protein